MAKLKIYKIDFGTKSGKYVGTQFVEALNRRFVLDLINSGYIFNKKSRKLKKITEVKNLHTEQSDMERDIIVRKFK